MIHGVRQNGYPFSIRMIVQISNNSEDLHVHRRLENIEEMCAIMHVKRLANVAQVLCAIYAAEPRTLDVLHATVA